MKLAIIELETHVECVHALCILLAGDPSITVSLFLAQHVWQELKEQTYLQQFSVFVKPADQPCRKFLSTHHAHLNQQDILILDTVHRFYDHYPVSSWKGQTLLRVHNARFYFDKWRAFSWSSWRYMSWSEIKYNLKLIFKEWDWFYVNSLRQQVDYISFMDTAMQQYAMQQKWCTAGQLVPPLPVSFSEPATRVEPLPLDFHIVIPGGVDQRRKDYDFVVSVLEVLVKKIKKPIQLTLLGKAGKAAQKRWIHPLEQLAAQNKLFSFRWFDQRVAQQQFEEIIESAHIILAPIQPYYFFKTYKEWYGKTKMSGINADIIRYLKPCLVPSAYRLPDELQPLSVEFTGQASLIEQLLQWSETPEQLNEFTPGALQIQKRYSKAQQEQEFKRVLQSLIKQRK